jgi:choline dehydrogenase-like flavoprotein
VADGSVFPRSIGRNPSRTIAALAERVAAGIIAQGAV